MTMIILLNKIDLLPADGEISVDDLLSRFPGSIAISAKNGSGLDELKARIISMLNLSIS